MATISIDQIAQDAYNAGFRGPDLVTAISIGMAESSGVTNAQSSDGYDSHGIWQFIPGTWQGTTGLPFADADNPQTNADAAYKLQKSSGWSQWSTYNNGAYKQYTAQATAAANSVQTGGKGSVLSKTGTDGSTPGTPSGSSSASSSGTSSAGSSNGSTDNGGLFGGIIEFAIEAGMLAAGIGLILFGGMEVFKDVA